MDRTPNRTVEDNLLVSSDLPPIAVQVDEELDYLGRLQFGIFGIADADVFMFGRTDAGVLTQSLLVQFEGFRGGNEYTYDYSSPDVMRLGKNDYQVDYFAADITRAVEEARPESDFAQEVEWLKGKGLRLPEEAAWVRFVRALGEDRRREILIIYTEDLAPSGLTANSIAPEDQILPEHAEFARGLRERALALCSVVGG